MRAPIVAEELCGLLRHALDAREAKAQTVELQEKLERESRLASIGRISAGLTHELASPVGAAVLNFHAVRRAVAQLQRGQDAPDLASAMDDLELSLRRVQDLLTTLRPVVRQEPVKLERLALSRVIDDAIGAAAVALAGVEVEGVLEPLVAMAERTPLAQLLVNLLTNAANAAKSLPSPRVRMHAYQAGEYAVISVRDNGPGVPLEFQERIFEPFFTTRRETGGTGLGLALCREYAQRMGGTLSLWSTPGRGACFRVALKMS